MTSLGQELRSAIGSEFVDELDAGNWRVAPDQDRAVGLVEVAGDDVLLGAVDHPQLERALARRARLREPA